MRPANWPRLGAYGPGRELDDFAQGTIGGFGNHLRRKSVFGGGLDHQRELRGGLGQFDRRLRIRVLRSVDDIAPMNEVFEGLGVEAEFFASNRSDQLGAGSEFRVVKHVVGAAGAEMLGVGRSKERALMMIEPPGDARRTRVFEIHNHIFVSVEETVCPGLFGAMSHAGEVEFGSRVEAFTVEAVEESGGSHAVKAMVVEAQSYASHVGGAAGFSKAQSHCAVGARGQSQ